MNDLTTRSERWVLVTTAIGWSCVAALLTTVPSSVDTITAILIMVIAIASILLFFTPGFPNRAVTLVVSWIVPLLGVVSVFVDSRQEGVDDILLKIIVTSVFQWIALIWMLTYGMVLLFAVAVRVSPGHQERFAREAAHCPWRQWWIIGLVFLVFKAILVIQVWQSLQVHLREV